MHIKQSFLSLSDLEFWTKIPRAIAAFSRVDLRQILRFHPDCLKADVHKPVVRMCSNASDVQKFSERIMILLGLVRNRAVLESHGTVSSAQVCGWKQQAC